LRVYALICTVRERSAPALIRSQPFTMSLLSDISRVALTTEVVRDEDDAMYKEVYEDWYASRITRSRDDADATMQHPLGGTDRARGSFLTAGGPHRFQGPGDRDLGMLLQQSRVGARMSQRELAERARVSFETVRGIENHTIRFPLRKVLDRLGSVLGVDLRRET